MLNITFMKRIKKNEAGFTIVELLIASAMSVVVLGLLAHVFRSQQRAFDTQTVLNTMQANGRGATEFVSRSVQNAGFNVKRGTRFLSASDHSLTAVYDENNDNVIQNNEVVTYTIANAWSGTSNDTFSFVSWFDVDSDGVIQSTENPTINVQMTASGPPFNLYKVIPNAAGTGIERNIVARNIDNMVIKYYDKDGNLLPRMIDTDADGIGDFTIDTNSDNIPDSGNWTYAFTNAELNDIRKVEIEMLARSRNPSPREVISSGSYAQGSFAAVISGSTVYNDKFYRDDFTAQMAPRNLTMSPWGSVAMVASPAAVDCPNASSVTATLLNNNGEAISGSTINFTATGGTTISVGSPTQTSDGNGEGSTSLTYDFSSPYFTSTISGSALVDDGSGNMKPIYSAAPVSFAFSAQGGFVDPFDGSQTIAWEDLVPGSGFTIPGGQEYFESTVDGGDAGTVNGCAAWQDYIVQTNVGHIGSVFPNNDYYGVILRHQDLDDYYYVRVKHQGSFYTLTIGEMIGGTESDKAVAGLTYNAAATFNTFTLKAQIQGDKISVKFWEPADPTDPGADEPVAWTLEATDPSYTSGKFGLEAKDDSYQFDNVVLENAPAII